ncbi:MAG: dethiobiotin synthase [Dehalococcoidia bacterium]
MTAQDTRETSARSWPAVWPGDRAVARHSRTLVEDIAPVRVASAKRAFSTRRVTLEDARSLVVGAVRPRAGDLVLARVERLRQHGRLELPSGRRALLHPGDEIIVACGNRYASDQFEAYVPGALGEAHLVAAGGIAGVAASKSQAVQAATEITLLGLLGDAEGEPLNLARYALPEPEVHGSRPPVIAVFGTAMNSGKTTTARFLLRGLREAGYRAGYAKLTGTGAGGDYWAMMDAGAEAVFDFTDAGLASTYVAPIPVLERTSIDLIGHLTAAGCDRIVVEIADGLLQAETAGLMRSDIFRALVDRVVFAAGDAIAANSGVALLRAAGFEVAGVSGMLTTSPLAVREARGLLDVPVLSKDDLNDAAQARVIATLQESVA